MNIPSLSCIGIAHAMLANSVRVACLCAMPVAILWSQDGPPVRAIGDGDRISLQSFGAIAAVRDLPHGRVLVNDIAARRLVMLDSTLALVSVVADSTASTATAYGTRVGALISYRGDSSLFVDLSSLSMLVIDPDGRTSRVLSVPRPREVTFLLSGPYGVPGVDIAGRLVYRGPAQSVVSRPSTSPSSGRADSAPILRVDLLSRLLDTAGFVRVPNTSLTVVRPENGRMMLRALVNPIPLSDDWAILADGAIAVIRGIDYHIDFIHLDGSISSSHRIPFAWHHLSDEDKVAFIDSARVALEARRKELSARAAGGTLSAPINSQQTQPIEFVPAADLPDYLPPLVPGAARGDADGNLWIRTTRITQNRPVYDVVNPRGELIDRVLLPVGRVLVGFGREGVLFLTVRDSSGMHLERARAR
jgi:hypothetical protein